MDYIRSRVFGGSCRSYNFLAFVARFTRQITCLPKSSLMVKFSPNGGRWELSSWSAVLTGVWLVGIGIAAAKEETIVVTAPASGDRIFAGADFSVEFDLAGGVESSFDIDLYQGSNKVLSWCDTSEGCEVFNGNHTVNAPNNTFVGEGYTVVVTERSSSESGSSGEFELLEPEPGTPSPSSLRYAEFQEVGGGGGAVGHMNLALVLVASICGLALAAALIATCVKARGRRTARFFKPKDSVSRDLESGGLAKQHPGANGGDFDSPGTDPKMDSLVKMTPSRGGDASQMRPHPRSLGIDAELDKYRSPGTALARGDHQRSRTVSRETAMSVTEDQPTRGSRSLSRTPGRSMSRTPSRTPTRTLSNRTRSRTPSRTPSSRALSHTPNRTPGRYRGGPVMMGTTPGKSMMTLRRMNTGGDGDEYTSDASGNWDVSGPPRMLGTSPEWSRSPRASGEMGERAARGRALPRYADERELPPRGTSTPRRTRTAHVYDYRRSMSVGREGPNRYGDPEEDWEVEYQRRAMKRRDLTTPSPELRRPRGRKTRTQERMARDARMRGKYYESPQLDGSLSWGRQDMSWSPSRHIPHRSGMSEGGQRKFRSNSDISIFSPDYYRTGRSRFSPARARSVGARSSRQGSSSSSGRHGSHRGSMVDVNEQDVSWEELRSAHQRGRSRNRPHGPTGARHSDADGVSSASGSSAARSGRARQYSGPHRLTTPGGGPLSIGVPHEPEGDNFAKTSMSVRSATKAFYHPGYSKYSRRHDSRSHSSGGDRRLTSQSQSPASRARTAREAAREAQESAERALAAAAAASRAADAAAQAAIDAEAEVKATVQREGGDDTPATSYSSPPADAPDPSSVSGASVRDRVVVGFDGNSNAGGSVGSGSASGSNGGKALIGTKVKTKEALAVMGCSDDAESLRCANGGWLAPHRNGGQDTAGGNGGDRNSDALGSVIRDSGAVAPGDDLAARRLAFVRQYSVASTCEGDSEYSMYHDNPPIVQVHAPAPVSVSAGMMRRAPYMSPGSGLTSFDESDLSFRDAQALDPPTLNPPPLRSEALSSPLSHVPPSSIGGSIGDGGSSFVGITVRKRESPSRAPDFKRRPRKGGRKLDNNGAVINSSEAGSTHEESVGY